MDFVNTILRDVLIATHVMMISPMPAGQSGESRRLHLRMPHSRHGRNEISHQKNPSRMNQ